MVQTMAKTYKTFDDIYTVFMDTTRVDSYQLPQTPEGMYALLEYALDRYAIEYDGAKEVEFIRPTETLSTELDKNDIMLIAGYMRLNIYQKIKDEFISTYDVLVDDIGIRNYKSQIDAKYTAIERQEREIEKMLLKMSEDFDVLV